MITQEELDKIKQMFDAGWIVQIARPDTSYIVRAKHISPAVMTATFKKLVAEKDKKCQDFLRASGMTAEEAVLEYDFTDRELITDDFTPFRALLRMAYKALDGVILDSGR